MNLDELAEAALAGDLRAKEKLARYLSRGLRRYFRSWWPPDVADDLAQLTLVTMLEKTSRFEPRGENAFVRWVYGIARRASWTKARNDAIMARKLGKLANMNRTPVKGLSSFIMLMESIEMLDHEIEHLRPAYRQAVEKHLGKQRGEVRSPDRCRGVTLHRARQQLRGKLAAVMGTPARPLEPAAPTVDTPAT